MCGERGQFHKAEEKQAARGCPGRPVQLNVHISGTIPGRGAAVRGQNYQTIFEGGIWNAAEIQSKNAKSTIV